MHRSLPLLLALATLGPQRAGAAGPPAGHGAGAGHAGAVRGPVGRGPYGPYGPGYRGYGYPYRSGYGYGYYGVGFGVGYGYPGYYYPGYAYPAYGYPAYVEVAPGPGAPLPPAPVGPPAAPPAGPDIMAVVPAGTGPASAGPDAEATVIVRAPTEAAVWINGEKTTQVGPRREFVSTGLVPGRSYTFHVRARWAGLDGKPVDVERRVSVQAGERRAVDFAAPPRAP